MNSSEKYRYIYSELKRRDEIVLFHCFISWDKSTRRRSIRQMAWFLDRYNNKEDTMYFCKQLPQLNLWTMGQVTRQNRAINSYNAKQYSDHPKKEVKMSLICGCRTRRMFFLVLAIVSFHTEFNLLFAWKNHWMVSSISAFLLTLSPSCSSQGYG